MLVAQIAYQRLTPAEQQKLQAQLASLKEGTHTYNAISAACFPDDLRQDKRLFGAWHYIGPPFNASGKPLPTGQNVVSALTHCVAVWNGSATDSRLTRPELLAMIMHLVGDVHQPLHCTTHRLQGKDDGNGNAVAVTNMQYSSHPNLHSFWDSAFQRAWNKRVVKKTFVLARPTDVKGTPVADRAVMLVAKFPPPKNWKAGGFDPARWESQSHAIGYRLGYKQLPAGENAASVALDKAYVDGANAAACQQIVIGGYRLGALLHNLLATAPAVPRRR